MTRYFEKFYNSDPMVEISADEASARGTYTIEDDVPLRRYRRFIDRELHMIGVNYFCRLATTILAGPMGGQLG